MKKAKNEWLIGLLVIGGYLIIPSFLFIPLEPLIKKGILTELLANLVILAIMGIMLGILYSEDLKDNLKVLKKDYKKILKTAIKYWLIGAVIMYASSVVIELLNLAPNVNQEANIQLLKEYPVAEFILALFLAPLVEELVFRRGLFKAIKNNHIYAIITGILFASIHVLSSLSQGKIMLLYIIPYAAVGIAFGYSYRKTNNIYGTMITHALHNLISLVLIIIL